MEDNPGLDMLALLLMASSTLVDALHEGVVARGFADVRPAHGFVFARLTPDGATVTELAEHLGMTKQAASEMVAELEAKGYVLRTRSTGDARARLVTLTERGWDCTRAATEAADDAARPWLDALGPARSAQLRASLLLVGGGGRLRPTW